MLQIKNCLSIWRTTGLGIVEPSLAILKLWHRSPSSSYPAPCRVTQREDKTSEDRAKWRDIWSNTRWWPHGSEWKSAGSKDQSLKPKAKYLLPSIPSLREEMPNAQNRHTNQRLWLQAVAQTHKHWSIKIRNSDIPSVSRSARHNQLLDLFPSDQWDQLIYI